MSEPISPTGTKAGIARTGTTSSEKLGEGTTDWRTAAMRLGEELFNIGPNGYYAFTPNEWLAWALNNLPKAVQSASGASLAMAAAPTIGDALDSLRDENQRFRNGYANLYRALQEAPGLPLELLDKADLEKWTDIITGILMALGTLDVSGKPQSPWEALLAVDGGNASKGQS